jgi:phosphopantothenoylcysteine decarboxylase/phosphopantothenate--cysteine ligase
LLGVSGGIAAYKAASLARALVREGANVQAVLTAGAAEFVGPATFEGLTGRSVPVGVFEDAHRILHVRLAREADVAVFAPATANLLAKFAHGLADDLVTSLYTCLTCPVVVAPAMHTEMWLHPATQANAELLARRGVHLVGPAEGELAGGDVGPGRLAEEPLLLAAVVAALAERSAGGASPLAGKRVVVTAAGTREPIDPVRFIGNRSSGRMGYAVAAEAVRRGAVVDLVSAPTHLPEPPGVTVHHVETALEMRAAVLPLAEKADVVIKAAAVADYRPVAYSARKLRKDEDDLTLVRLERNPDILAELGEARRSEGSQGGGPVLVGFAAETDLAEQRGIEKLRRKGLDLVVVNRVGVADAGFNVDTNRAVLFSRDGTRTDVPLTTKAVLAGVILDRVEELLRPRADDEERPGKGRGADAS